MPILTVTAPYKNSARNVTRTTKRISIQELRRANKLVSQGTQSPTFSPNFFTIFLPHVLIDFSLVIEQEGADVYSALGTVLQKSDFFNCFDMYIIFDIGAIEKGDFLKW